MGVIVIDIWEKSIFFGSIGSQKGAKNVIFVRGGALKAPPYGRVKQILTIGHVSSFHVYETICMIASLYY